MNKDKIPDEIWSQFDTPDKRALAPTKPPEEGAFGLMRNGEVVGPFDEDGHTSYPFQVESGRTWTAKGAWFQNGIIDSFDIIAVWHAPAQEAAPADPPVCQKCGGAGWLWGHELDDYEPPHPGRHDDTRYSCDAEGCAGRLGTPPTDPLDAVRAAIRALGDDDLARFVEVIDGGYSTLGNTLRNWVKEGGE